MVRLSTSIRISVKFTIATLLMLFNSGNAEAVPGLGNPTNQTDPSAIDGDDTNESFDELVNNAQELLDQSHPIEARTKLQRALQLRPNDYRPHLYLGQYYLMDVRHFILAYRYILKAEQLFSKEYGSADGSINPVYSRQHALLLYLRSEAELNLDKYSDSLSTLNRIESLDYITIGFPGTKAWVLMKLKRIDEAIRVAQSGLLAGADPRRTWNILGILLSVHGSRELSLDAFARAIAAELSLGSLGQVATPLNNAGEVYRELFRDSLAEASWLKATRLPDGCDHILPSLNLSILYIDELRLLQAERVLKDFEACFAQQSLRTDTEHRALLALARGKITLRTGNIDAALNYLNDALSREQWFGKIGTNENDVRFATTITMAQALEAKAAALKDTVRDEFATRISDIALASTLRIQAWWYLRQARKIAIDELGDLEDLSIRNTDTIIEYPTFGDFLATFPYPALSRRLKRMTDEDSRKEADTYYDMYRAEGLYEDHDYEAAVSLLASVGQRLQPTDRLALVHVRSLKYLAEKATAGWWHFPTEAEIQADRDARVQIYELLPSAIRFNDLMLPISLQRSANEKYSTEAKRIETLLATRFEFLEEKNSATAKYAIRVSDQGVKDGLRNVELSLFNVADGSIRASHVVQISQDGFGYEEGVNKFIGAAFQHKVDPPSEPVPKLELLRGIM